MKAKSEGSLQVLMRLLIDEIVEDLSQRHRMQEQVCPSVCSPCLAISPQFFWTMALISALTVARLCLLNGCATQEGKGGDEGHNGA